MEYTRDLKIPLANQLKKLDVGDSLICPPEEVIKAASYASKYGFMWGWKLKSHKDVERRACIVTREE